MAVSAQRVLENLIPAALVAVIFAIGAWLMGYGGLVTSVDTLNTEYKKMSEKVDKLKEAQDSRVIPAVERIPHIEGSLEHTRETAAFLRRKLNDEVIEWINTHQQEHKKAGPFIRPVDLEPLYQNQRELESELESAKRASTASGRRVIELEAHLEGLSAVLWEVGESELRAQLEESLEKAMEPIMSEWEQALESQSRGTPVPPGLSFIPSGTVISTRPVVKVLVVKGGVKLIGVVPSDRAKASVTETAEAFRPKPPRGVDASGLKVEP